ncbi:MAG TPA: hypothetical protein VFU15_04290 [Bacteroidia bacterium]|nr:hypothetical protein [Bacteroidia bacterium]
MKYFFSLVAIALLSACGGDKTGDTHSPAKDSTPATVKTNPNTVILQTDSGQLEIETVNGKKQGHAWLRKDGKLIAEGSYDNDVPAGAWVNYGENGRVIKAFHMSEGKKLFDLDSADFNFAKFQSRDFGAGFLVPEKWQSIKSPNPALLVSFTKKVPDTVKVAPNMNVARGKLKPGENLQKLADLQLKMLHDAAGHVDVVQENLFTVDSCQSFQRYGMYDMEDSRVGFLDAIIIHGDDVWFFSCEAQNKNQGEFLRYQGVFEKIVESFHRVN